MEKQEEFNLSEKIVRIPNRNVLENHWIYVEDVKEFIRLLKEAGQENDWDIMLEDGEGDIIISFNDWIDKLAGDKLVEKQA